MATPRLPAEKAEPPLGEIRGDVVLGEVHIVVGGDDCDLRARPLGM
jgi:hypothetical protein